MATSAREPLAIRRAALPDGRELVVRPVTEVDIGLLTELYDELDDEARHRRFFSAYRPGHRYFERLVHVEDRGGAELIALACGPGGAEEVVGEAGYELLPNGNGELAIVVARDWRGWLGPFLLDAVLEVAASHGVPNLEADVLTTNGPMLALARSRGHASMPQPDWTVQRVVVGAACREPGWPPERSGPRVLVEGSGGHWHAEGAATGAGLEVLACSGPSARRRPCPALEGRPCPLVAGADVVVVSGPPADARWDALRDLHPGAPAGVPVCVERLRSGDRARAGERELPEVGAAEVVALVARSAQERRGQEGGDPALPLRAAGGEAVGVAGPGHDPHLDGPG